jgi:hypothetical protein
LFFMQPCVESQDSSQSGAPLQFKVQSLVQPVILQACEPWQVRVQSLPVQSMVQEPPVQVWMQSPPGHCIEQVESVHVRWQSPWHPSEHEAEPLHVW